MCGGLGSACRVRPRSGRSARHGRGRPADLRGNVLRDDDRPDLHQPVPDAHPGHGARRHVDPVEYAKNAESRVTNQGAAFDAVFATFLELCESAGAGHCALAGHGETVAQRVARVIDTAKRSTIPAPHSDPPGVSTTPTSFSRRSTRSGSARTGPVSQRTSMPRRTATRRNWRTRPAGCGPRPCSRGDDVVVDLVPRRFRPEALAVVAECHPEVHRLEHVLRTAAGVVALGAVCVELAGAEHRSV